MSFVTAVHGLVRSIPRGQVATYGQIAAYLGRPRAARAVGSAMKRCPPGVPWHRVVNARGRISLRSNAGGMLTQRLLLELEGIRVREGRVSLHRYRWRDTPGSQRLAPPRSSIRSRGPGEARVQPSRGRGKVRVRSNRRRGRAEARLESNRSRRRGDARAEPSRDPRRGEAR